MNIALDVITDGRREFIPHTVKSVFDNVIGLSYPGIMVNDCAEDDTYGTWLEATFGAKFEYLHHSSREGLAAGIRQAWYVALKDPKVRYLWHQEDDYFIPWKVDLAPLVQALNSDPTIAELTLKRTCYSAEEYNAGGYMQAHPADYSQQVTSSGFSYVRHDQMFFSQPSLVPRAVAELCCASDVELTEPNLTELLVGAGYHFGVVGEINDQPLCDHIGIYRSLAWRQ